MSKIFFISWTSLSLGIALFLFLLGSASEKPGYQPVEIVSGSGFKDIAESLHRKGIIRSPRAFIFYGIISGSAHRLKPGNYLLNVASSTPAIIAVIERGPAADISVTFPEGATLKDIDEMLSRSGILPKGAIVKFSIRDIAAEYEFLRDAKSLEGFLFPDTYRFFLNSETGEVVKKFLDNFGMKAWPLLRAEKDFKRKLIIASLLEKEVSEYGDRQLVAGIINDRLAIGVPLQIDATITYAKCLGAFITCEDPKVYRRDLGFQSEYNTYLYNGLPPGPIGNPGINAIKAALNPVKSSYFYYLSDPKTKQTIFSKTLDEHNENRAKYLGS